MIRYVSANPCVSCEDSFKRSDQFESQSDHDNHLTKELLRVGPELLCTGCMGEIYLPNVAFKRFQFIENIDWILSTVPVHRSLLTGKTINLHGGEQEHIECDDCTDGNNIYKAKDPRYKNVSVEFNDFKPVSLEDLYLELPEFLKA